LAATVVFPDALPPHMPVQNKITIITNNCNSEAESIDMSYHYNLTQNRDKRNCYII
jgi:hypothetical protein